MSQIKKKNPCSILITLILFWQLKQLVCVCCEDPCHLAESVFVCKYGLRWLSTPVSWPHLDPASSVQIGLLVHHSCLFLRLPLLFLSSCCLLYSCLIPSHWSDLLRATFLYISFALYTTPVHTWHFEPTCTACIIDSTLHSWLPFLLLFFNA